MSKLPSKATIEKWYQDAIRERLSDMSDRGVRQDVDDMLRGWMRNALEQYVGICVGTWDTSIVDLGSHESVIAKHIKEQAEASAREIVKEIGPITLTPKERASLRQHYREQFLYKLKEQVQLLATKGAEEQIERFAQEIAGSVQSGPMSEPGR